MNPVIYSFDNKYENLLNLSDNIQSEELNNIQLNQISDQISNTQLIQTPSISLPQITYWRPSIKLQRLHNRCQNKIWYQWPCIPCVFCGRLLYFDKASWILYESSINYPLQQNLPDIPLPFNPNTN